MDINSLLEAVKEEISRLQKVVTLLEGESSGRGRGKKKRHLSAAARKKISDAQKRRWAKRKEKA